MLTDTIGYIRFDNFTHTTHNDVVATLKDMKAKGMRALILDLSMNFGGLTKASGNWLVSSLTKVTPLSLSGGVAVA